MQPIVLDSNILVKLVVNEPGSSEVSEHVEALLEGGFRIGIIPEHNGL